MTDYQYLKISITNSVAHIQLNRPDKANALNETLWQEIEQAMQWTDQTPEVRVVMFSGEGKHFCAGIDLQALAQIGATVADEDEARRSDKLRHVIKKFQASFTAIEQCRKPVLAAIHGGCIGGAVDLISATDIRYCSQDAYFVIKEVDIGMTADVGTLQRLPHIIGDGMMRELAYTGRKCLAEEAQQIGLVNRVFANREELLKEVTFLAQTIAEKSPLAIRGIKEMILYTRDHNVADSLNYIATWNAGQLLSQDLQEAMMAQMEKRKPNFRD